MGNCRDTKNIWWYLFGRYSFYQTRWKRWRGHTLFTKEFWTGYNKRYIFHDSFGQFWNRIFVCPIFGHKKIQDISDPNEPMELHCFKCEKKIEGRRKMDSTSYRKAYMSGVFDMVIAIVSWTDLTMKKVTKVSDKLLYDEGMNFCMEDEIVKRVHCIECERWHDPIDLGLSRIYPVCLGEPYTPMYIKNKNYDCKSFKRKEE
jgi:hypothetical protein